jgi:hypothetical protein
MRDRQRELDKAFKKVAAAQRLALSVLAEHSQRKLARDKNAHKKVPEFDEVNQQLQERLERHREILRREYEYKVANANRVLSLEKENLEIQFRVSSCRFVLIPKEIQMLSAVSYRGKRVKFNRNIFLQVRGRTWHSSRAVVLQRMMNTLRRMNPKRRLAVDVFVHLPER